MNSIGFAGLGLCLGLACSAPGAEGEWRELFNGRDLAGWVNVNCAPNTFTARDGIIVSTGVPTGVMRTVRQYENFELELDWKHLKAKGNAGLFVWAAPLTAPGTPFARAIEVQILDGRETKDYTSHGDVFAIHGATFKPDRAHPGGWMRCLPSEKRSKPAGEWNHYRVLCSNGVVQLAVNGKVVSGGSASKPSKGYLCLESEGSECHFKNIRVRELPSSGATAAESAPLAEDFRPLYTGIDLSGWRVDAGHGKHWQAKDWTLDYDGKGEGTNQSLWTEKEFGDFVLVVDWRMVRAGRQGDLPQSGIMVRGRAMPDVRFNSAAPANEAGKWNRSIVTMRGDKLTVTLNEKPVVENAVLSGAARRGAVGLRHRGEAMQFANIFVKEIE